MAFINEKHVVTDNALAISSTAGANNGASVAKPDSADLVVTAVLGGTTVAGSHTLKVQGSNDNSTWTDVTADSTGGTAQPLTAAGSVTFHLAQLGYQYYRVVDTTTGTPGSANVLTSHFVFRYLRFSDDATLS